MSHMSSAWQDTSICVGEIDRSNECAQANQVKKRWGFEVRRDSSPTVFTSPFRFQCGTEAEAKEAEYDAARWDTEG